MPRVDIPFIKGGFDAARRRKMIADVTETIVAIEGEAMTAADVRAEQAQGA